MCFFNLFFFPQTWEQITATINETFHPGKEDIQREMQKVKQKWYDLRTDFNRAKQHATGTGGGPRKAPFRWEEQVGRIMGDTNLQTVFSCFVLCIFFHMLLILQGAGAATLVSLINILTTECGVFCKRAESSAFSR